MKLVQTMVKPKGRQEFYVDDVKVVFLKKKVKNINIRVKSPEGLVQVSAPSWVTQSTVEGYIRQKMNWIKKRQKVIAESDPRVDYEQSPEVLAAWKDKIAAQTEELIAEWEPIMGVASQKLVFRNMKSRWGSCNPKTGRICINIQLARFPDKCLEYVVVHELCHLLERGHGQRFKELMTSFMPDWQERRSLLTSGDTEQD